MLYATTVNKILTDDHTRNEIIDRLNLTYPTITRKPEIKDSLVKYLDGYSNDLIVIVEDNYIDKVYRNSFSHFYSTKLFPYPEYCVRLSFLDPNFPIDRFGDVLEEELKNLYYGFMVLRPIYPGCIGRTCVKPEIKINGGSMKICKSPIRTSVLGYKAFIKGFPHSSQDDQYSTCAETSIWSLMEYYGNKYPEYSPILPSDIHEILDSESLPKHVPSNGLSFESITLLIKKFGLECETYFLPDGKDPNYTPDDFYQIFSCYIESGIPMIVCVGGSQGFGHAIVCIGKEDWDRNEIDKTPDITVPKGIKYKLWENVKGKFIFNDDNRSCYASDDFSNPTPQHAAFNPEIFGIIVPTHRKIYMTAPQALNISRMNALSVFSFTSEITFRTYLTSGNSFKNALIQDKLLDKRYKEFFVSNLQFPKFIWVTEIAEEKSFKNFEVDGIIILDATENGKYEDIDPFPPLFGAFLTENLIYDNTNSVLRKNSLPLQFKMKSFSNL